MLVNDLNVGVEMNDLFEVNDSGSCSSLSPPRLGK